MAEDWLDAFIAAEGLPQSFRTTFAAVCGPLADLAARTRGRLGRTVVIGLCGPQGSGKSTIAAAAGRLLLERGLGTAVLSLDDLYLSRGARAELAATIHPLLITRGPPGTHDPALGIEVLAALARAGNVALPRFDKGRDSPRARSTWPRVEGPLDVVLFEGWCVGARAQAPEALREPVNALERYEDPDGRWRGYVNTALEGPYQPLFRRIDRLALLRAPSFEMVAAWRAEQESKLRARTGRGMDAGQIPRFVAHYERLSRWIADEMPARADQVFPLAIDRTPLA